MGTRLTKYTKEFLEPIIMSSHSKAEVISKLGWGISGGSYRAIKTAIVKFNINTDHFTGSRWNKGLTVNEHASIRKYRDSRRVSNSEVFCENSRLCHGPRISKRLIELGWEYACQHCGINKWLGNEITLHLDHINGNHTDNRFENLRFLCPNCHQQTNNWGNKKAGMVELVDTHILGVCVERCEGSSPSSGTNF